MEQKNLKLYLSSDIVFCNSCIDRGGTQALPAVTRLSDSLNIVSACTVLFKAMACGMQHMHVYEECSWTRWIGSVLSLQRRLRDTSSALWSGSYLHQMPLIPDLFYCMTDSDLTWSIYCMTKRWPLSWSFARSDTEQNLPFPPSLLHCWAFSLLLPPYLLTFFSFMLLSPFYLAAASSQLWLFFYEETLIHSCFSSYCSSQYHKRS